jgi:glycosyltransferase involved in cell wall biosynthesis
MRLRGQTGVRGTSQTSQEDRTHDAPDRSTLTPGQDQEVEVSVIFPCLNEEGAIGDCVKRARRALEQSGFNGEIIVVDNASTDRSAAVAFAAGARVVNEPIRGYGSAYRRGLEEARGRYIVMLDGDGTYPVELAGEFVRRLRAGADMVCGNRFAGSMETGAMPWLNRYVGNPALSALTRLLFKLPIRDVHCGMRAIRRAIVDQLNFRTTGMEFATEMIVKTIDNGLRIDEVAIPYRPRIGESKLSRFRDAWRHIEYMLVFSPSVLFLWPGLALLACGLVIQLALLWGPRAFLFHVWSVHTNLLGLAAALVGSTLLVMGAVGAAFAGTVGMHFGHSWLTRVTAQAGDGPWRRVGLVGAALGASMWAVVATRWIASNFGALDAIPVLTLATSFLASGLELIAGGFLVSLIRVQRR